MKCNIRITIYINKKQDSFVDYNDYKSKQGLFMYKLAKIVLVQ